MKQKPNQTFDPQLQNAANVKKQQHDKRSKQNAAHNEEEEALQAFIGHVEQGDGNPQDC